MCVDTMEAKLKRSQTKCPLRHSLKKPRDEVRWGCPRFSTVDQAVDRLCLAAAARMTVRKYLHLGRRRARRVPALPANLFHKRRAVSWRSSMPPGAMAPRNTTQYLMNNAYEDLMMDNIQFFPAVAETSTHVYGECPRTERTAMDADNESYVAFLQRDMEEVFDLCRRPGQI